MEATATGAQGLIKQLLLAESAMAGLHGLQPSGKLWSHVSTDSYPGLMPTLTSSHPSSLRQPEGKQLSSQALKMHMGWWKPQLSQSWWGGPPPAHPLELRGSWRRGSEQKGRKRKSLKPAEESGQWLTKRRECFRGRGIYSWTPVRDCHFSGWTIVWILLWHKLVPPGLNNSSL